MRAWWLSRSGSGFLRSDLLLSSSKELVSDLKRIVRFSKFEAVEVEVEVGR